MFIYTPLGLSGYRRHTDCTEDDNKRDRMATVLVYLDDVAEGGETTFPGKEDGPGDIYRIISTVHYYLCSATIGCSSLRGCLLLDTAVVG